ncbi:unnamed protein product [Linum tenue]|uniref:Retrotransposon gag domain-containing protein n=1 Tax=Linum tenue TaxID=586396 RepID=A0AAV0NUP3_9ROSI|nr:unnamed protein product [Linum tenue]
MVRLVVGSFMGGSSSFSTGGFAGNCHGRVNMACCWWWTIIYMRLRGRVRRSCCRCTFQKAIKVMGKPLLSNLTGPAARWYMQLESSKVKRWQDLADAFMKHYKHNQDFAPDREDTHHGKERGGVLPRVCPKVRGKAADV